MEGGFDIVGREVRRYRSGYVNIVFLGGRIDLLRAGE
jgi:hypothetical protein